MKTAHLMLLTLAIPAAAQAHTGIDASVGLVAGFMHPLQGWDHMLAMLAVGIWGAQLGGRRIWLLPSAFVGVMAASALLAMAGVATAFTEAGIVASDVALALFIVSALRISPAVSVLAVALFAFFHGAAHGSEVPAQADGLSYIVGFAVATAILHLAGIGIGLLLRNTHLLALALRLRHE